jgi:hypothetical protein
MDFHYSKPFGSHRLVTCFSKRKIHSSEDFDLFTLLLKSKIENEKQTS